MPKEKRSKLEPSRKKGTFVSYSDMSKDYRIYILYQRYIEVSRDVIFHEEAAFRHSRELRNVPKESPLENSDSPPSENQQEEEDEPSISNAPIES